MKERDGFASGFLVGAIFGSVVGGIVGALVTYRRDDPELAASERQIPEAKKASTAKRSQMRALDNEGEMEMARRSLEDKIAQLNATIDEVRQQLGDVNDSPQKSMSDRSSVREELR
ncbi:hypothetical protein [Iningainema tapete]|uniref:Gas vesicle protein n=1 Tax=Iningainema tapete BLCC-T55 TaxID=2748662 RepID=A0A8J7C798_9CYAN|nr:hypothetical protein [Iningainema tapete]MBD2775394.1 hypothetical protein [Iningainema tapete BLCC-T55]